MSDDTELGAGEFVSLDMGPLSKILARYGERVADMTPTMQVVAEMLVADVNDVWESAGFGTWPQLAPATIKKRRGTIAQILKDTGRAAASVQALAGPDFAEASTDVSYMKYHVGDAARTVIPRRDPFDLPEPAFDRATEYILEHIIREDIK